MGILAFSKWGVIKEIWEDWKDSDQRGSIRIPFNWKPCRNIKSSILINFNYLFPAQRIFYYRFFWAQSHFFFSSISFLSCSSLNHSASSSYFCFFLASQLSKSSLLYSMPSSWAGLGESSHSPSPTFYSVQWILRFPMMNSFLSLSICLNIYSNIKPHFLTSEFWFQLIYGISEFSFFNKLDGIWIVPYKLAGLAVLYTGAQGQ